jgi:hypothetical protein
MKNYLPLLLLTLFAFFSCKVTYNDDSTYYTDFSKLNTGDPSEEIYELTVSLETPMDNLVDPTKETTLMERYDETLEAAQNDLLDNEGTNGSSSNAYETDKIDAVINCSITSNDTDSTFLVYNTIESTITLTNAYIVYIDDETNIKTEGTISGSATCNMIFDLSINSSDQITSGTITITSEGNYSVSGFEGLNNFLISYTVIIDATNDEISSLTGSYTLDNYIYELVDDFAYFFQYES